VSDPFEILVIQELKGLKEGQDKIYEAFSEHKDDINKKFIDLALKSAEQLGAAKVKAKFWSISGAAFTTVFAGSYEWLRHHFNWR
jgi:hypothetical protein